MFVIASMISIPFTEMKRVYVFAIAVVWRRVGVNEPLERFKKWYLSLKFRVFFAILLEFFRKIYTMLTMLPRQAYTWDGSNISATIITSTKGPIRDILWCPLIFNPHCRNIFAEFILLSSTQAFIAQWQIYIVKFWMRHPYLGVQILSISCSFGKIWQNSMLAPPLRRKSWIRHCWQLCIIKEKFYLLWDTLVRG